jgi:hypothetical protein
MLGDFPQLTAPQLIALLQHLDRGAQKQAILELLANNQDPNTINAVVADLALQHKLQRKKTVRIIWWSLAVASGGFSAYHGYRRNRKSAGWAIGWGLLGMILPIPSVITAMVQGYGKLKIRKRRIAVIV